MADQSQEALQKTWQEMCRGWSFASESRTARRTTGGWNKGRLSIVI